MAYAMIHVAALDHWKVGGLTDAAFRLWVAGLCYAQDHLTDGVLDRRVLKMLRAKGTSAVIAELVEARLWDEHVAGYQIHDYADWNRTKEDVEKRREKWRRNKRGSTVESTGASTGASTVESTGASTVTPPTKTVQDEYKTSTRQDEASRVCDDAPPARLARDPGTGYGRGSAVVKPAGRSGLVHGAPPSAVFACAAFHVPGFLHAELRGKLENAGACDPEATLQAWYGRVKDDHAGRDVPADTLPWLRRLFDAWRHPAPLVGIKGRTDGNAAALAAFVRGDLR